MKDTKLATIKWRTCSCTEVGVDPNGILVWFWKQKYPDAHFVEKCAHWTTGEAKVLTP